MPYRPRDARPLAIGLILAACGSSSGSSLFRDEDVGPLGGDAGSSGHGASSASGGSYDVTASGGAPPAGGTSSASSGGAGSVPTGGSSSSGGTLSSSGGSGSVTTGGTPANGGASDGGSADAGPPPELCNYSGTWGTYIQVPVSWPDAPFVLIGGTGTLQQWNLTEQVQDGLTVQSSTVPCMIFLPDLQSSILGGFYKYGIRFPAELFDGGGIPPTEFVLTATVTSGGISVESNTFAILVGLTMTNPTTTTWPGAHGLSLEDHDGDTAAGVTVIPAADQGYSLPPVDLAGNYADRVYIAERTVSRLSGSLTDCDEVLFNVEIVPVGAQSGIQSSVVGCHLESGEECTPEQSDFVDAIRPQYTPSGVGTSKSVRMPSGSTCADVRALFPVQ